MFTPPSTDVAWAGVDDGSEPDVLLCIGSTLTAWDLRTGQQLWHSDGPISAALILDGTVYSVGAGTVHAQDARTGHERWSVDTRIRGADGMATDGRELLVVGNPGAGASTLRRIDLADGTGLWQTELPVAAQGLEVSGGRLFALTTNGVAALG
jgi:outer membrane protein assembly factor BamB